FVNAQGMSLYWRTDACNNDRETKVEPIAPEGGVRFTVMRQRTKTCLEQNPLFLAPADAKPVGKWTILTRADGSRQWAYDGKGLHTSRKDKAAGDINGSYPTRLGRGLSHAAVAPLDGTPPGIKWRVTAVGLTLTDESGRSLYYQDRDQAACVDACARTWLPL